MASPAPEISRGVQAEESGRVHPSAFFASRPDEWARAAADWTRPNRHDRLQRPMRTRHRSPSPPLPLDGRARAIDAPGTAPGQPLLLYAAIPLPPPYPPVFCRVPTCSHPSAMPSPHPSVPPLPLDICGIACTCSWMFDAIDVNRSTTRCAACTMGNPGSRVRAWHRPVICRMESTNRASPTDAIEF